MKKFYSMIKKSGTRQTSAICAIIIGVVLIVYSKHSMHRVEEAKSKISHVKDFFTNATGIWDPVIKFFGGQANEEASQYDTTLTTLLYLGIALVILGVIALLWPKRKMLFRKR